MGTGKEERGFDLVKEFRRKHYHESQGNKKE